MVKIFIKNIVIFLIPVIVFLLISQGPFYFAGYVSGEFRDIDKAIETQREEHNILIGLGYNEQTAYYKLCNANYYEAPVIALGTSRVMQFKGECFNGNFYNCGGAVSGNYNEYKNFLENLRYTPKMVVIGLDTWVFNDEWNRDVGNYDEFQVIHTVDREKKVLIKSIKQDWKDEKWEFKNLNDYPNNIGFNGRIKDAGFMYDGSYYYGYVYRSPEEQEDYQFSNTIGRIDTGTARFEWGEHIDEDTIVQLDNLLSYCKENNIEAIGFIAPFAPTVYKHMLDDGKFGYLSEITPECKILFDKYQFEFYDYVEVSQLGVTDDYFIDGFHGSEVAYAKIIMDMVEKDSKLSEYVNIEHTKNLIENAFDGRTFCDPDKRFR